MFDSVDGSDFGRSKGARWRLVHAKTREEVKAESHLRRQGYETFLPLGFRTIRHARKTRIEKRPFFPSYLFVKLDVDRDVWRPINGTCGVLRVVTVDNRPASVPVGLVEALIAATNAEGVVAPAPAFEAGECVRIVGGPFLDRIAQIERMSGEDRVRVLLTIMNVETRVEVSKDQIARL